MRKKRERTPSSVGVISRRSLLGGAISTAALAPLAVAAATRGPSQQQASSSLNVIAGGTTDGAQLDAGPNGGEVVRAREGSGVDARAAFLYEPQGLAPVGSDIVFADSGYNLIRRLTPAGQLSIIAGTGKWGIYKNAVAGDGPALSSDLTVPSGTIVGPDGSLVFVEYILNRVRKIDNAGNVVTIVGKVGLPGYSGDGGPPLEAQLGMPKGLATDSHGNLFIAEQYTYVVRKLDAEGNLSTAVGTGSLGTGGEGAVARKTSIGSPSAIAVDSQDRLLVGDAKNNRIWAVAPGGRLSTFAGTGVAGHAGEGVPATKASFDGIDGLTVDRGDGSVYVSEYRSQTIRRIGPDGIITTVAAGAEPLPNNWPRPATPNAAQLEDVHPTSTCFDANGSMVVIDLHQSRVIRLNSVRRAAA